MGMNIDDYIDRLVRESYDGHGVTAVTTNSVSFAQENSPIVYVELLCGICLRFSIIEIGSEEKDGVRCRFLRNADLHYGCPYCRAPWGRPDHECVSALTELLTSLHIPSDGLQESLENHLTIDKERALSIAKAVISWNQMLQDKIRDPQALSEDKMIMLKGYEHQMRRIRSGLPKWKREEIFPDGIIQVPF